MTEPAFSLDEGRIGDEIATKSVSLNRCEVRVAAQVTVSAVLGSATSGGDPGFDANAVGCVNRRPHLCAPFS